MNRFHASLAHDTAHHAGPAAIDLAYQCLGPPDAPAALLIMGIAAQSIHWPDAFCNALLDAGLRVIRFDNRDSGASTRIAGTPAPDLPAALTGDFSSVSYTLADMASDAVGLLDFLGIPQAHFVGASLGGQIAQAAAIAHPGRLRSLTSMMSTTGDPKVGQPSPAVLRALFSAPAITRDDVIQRMVLASRLIGSPAWPADETEVAANAARAYDRGHDPVATARQAVATVASGDRTAQLRELRLPALVIHGLADPMCDVSGGRATAEAIPGAELLLIEGMGHNLPPGLRSPLAACIAGFIWRTELACHQPVRDRNYSNRSSTGRR